MRFTAPLPAGTNKVLQDKLSAMMGVKNVTVAGDAREIIYDLLQAIAKQIEAEIIKLLIGLGYLMALVYLYTSHAIFFC